MTTLFRKEDALKKVSNSLAVLEVSTRNLGLMRLYDQNILAESFAAKLLNIVYGYDLINLNAISKTYAATDLGDFSGRLCFQVTYTGIQNHRTKIQNSLDKFSKYHMSDDFDRFCFLFLGPKQQTYSTPFTKDESLDFDPYRDILNLGDIVRELPNLTDAQLVGLVALVESELRFEGMNSSHLHISSFPELAHAIWPLLAENGRAFQSFGPNSGAEIAATVRWDLELWQNAKHETILPNNQQILKLIDDFPNLIPDKYRQIISVNLRILTQQFGRLKGMKAPDALWMSGYSNPSIGQ